jgi:hypothetical protein
MAPSSQKTSSGSVPGKNQKSILGFFQRQSTVALQPHVNGVSAAAAASSASSGAPPKQKLVQKPTIKVGQNLTPAPSSDAVDEDEEDEDVVPRRKPQRPIGLPSPITPGLGGVRAGKDEAGLADDSPSHKVRSPS